MNTVPAVLRVGDIFCCHDPYSLLSDCIGWIEGSHWTHVAWMIDEGHAVQALGRGVTITPLRKFVWKPGRAMAVRIKPDLIDPTGLGNALSFARAQKGRPYDYVLLCELLWAYATHSRGWYPEQGLRKSYICSELIAQPLWQFAKFTFNDNVPWDNTTPSDIAISRKVEIVWQ